MRPSFSRLSFGAAPVLVTETGGVSAYVVRALRGTTESVGGERKPVYETEVRLYVETPTATGRRTMRRAWAAPLVYVMELAAGTTGLRLRVPYRTEAMRSARQGLHHRSCHCRQCKGTDGRLDVVVTPGFLRDVVVRLDALMESGEVTP